jgi:archaetidylinositol phosphate synthase
MLDTILGQSSVMRRVQFAFASGLSRLGLGPNDATILGTVSGLMAGLAFARGLMIVGVLLVGASALVDAVDGTIAREFAVATQLGGMLDLCSDRVVEFAVITGIAWRRPELYFPALILVGTWYVNITAFLAAGAALERCGPKLIDYPPGLVERAELIIFFVFLAMLPRQFGPWLCYAYSGLELITATQRLLYARRMLSARSNP